MIRILLAALALACACSPAFAGAACEPVTWGAVGFILLMIVLVGLALGALLFVLSIIASSFNH